MKIEKLIIYVSIVIAVGILSIHFAQQSKTIIRQGKMIESLQQKISLVESNHVQLLGTWRDWQKANDRFDEALIKSIKSADDSLYKEVGKLNSFDALVIEHLRSISAAQNSVVNTIIGLSSTNIVDKQK
jgi:predicted PurR-regulated permease PerM